MSGAANDKNPKAFWNMIKAYRKSVRREVSSEDWYKYFSGLFNPQSNDGGDNDITDHHYEEPSIENHSLDRPILETEVRNAIKNIKNGKSSGIDGLSIDCLKSCPDYVTCILSEDIIPPIGHHLY